MTRAFNDVWSAPSQVHHFLKSGALWQNVTDITSGIAIRVFCAYLMTGWSPLRSQVYIWDATVIADVNDPDIYLQAEKYHYAPWTQFPAGVSFKNGLSYRIDGDTGTELTIVYQEEN